MFNAFWSCWFVCLYVSAGSVSSVRPVSSGSSVSSISLVSSVSYVSYVRSGLQGGVCRLCLIFHHLLTVIHGLGLHPLHSPGYWYDG